MKKRISSALAIAAAGLCTSTYGDLVVFVNDNPDYEMRIGGWLSVPAEYQGLDITLDAWSQPVASTSASSFSDSTFALHAPWWYEEPHTSYVSFFGKYPVSGVGFAESVILFDDELGADRSFRRPLTVGDGSVIDESLEFESGVEFSIDNDTNGLYFLVPDAPRFVVPVFITMADGDHYGFVEFAYSSNIPRIFETTYQPTRWGYETDPDTAVVVPDSCSADFNIDGVLNYFDVSSFVLAYVAQDPAADLVGDGAIDPRDLFEFLSLFNAGCP
tara:strand:- start:79 stop:897 length:819 start_codon:yes stop_codon:yes gene_type:complete